MTAPEEHESLFAPLLDRAMSSRPGSPQSASDHSLGEVEPTAGPTQPARYPDLVFEEPLAPQGFWRTVWDMLTRKPLPPLPPDVGTEPYGGWRTLWEMLTLKPIDPPDEDEAVDPFAEPPYGR